MRSSIQVGELLLEFYYSLLFYFFLSRELSSIAYSAIAEILITHFLTLYTFKSTSFGPTYIAQFHLSQDKWASRQLCKYEKEVVTSTIKE